MPTMGRRWANRARLLAFVSPLLIAIGFVSYSHAGLPSDVKKWEKSEKDLDERSPRVPDADPSLRRVADSPEKPITPGPDFKTYVQKIPGTEFTIKMIPVKGGRFTMGARPELIEELGVDNEGPMTEVEVSPFWIQETEMSWEIYDVFSFAYDVKAGEELKKKGGKLTPADLAADAVSRPTPPYEDMTFGYGHDGNPALCMTHFAAMQFCEWLSAKTGKHYRLPTEAEWELAARGGTKTDFHFGNDAKMLGEYDWYFENANDKPQKLKLKKPNPLGLFDMHGNVSEWCLDKYVDDYFARFPKDKVIRDPLIITDENEYHTARGGSWIDDAELSRSSSRQGATEDWSSQDPQIPKSVWYHTDATNIGFRVVRPYRPGEETK
ncbi:Serine/threonine-protein kinase pkn1 [Planctomycetes bacterium Pan216]|uniref:Serine/threonine-protein kinase pkn1 n=1 Tax=Kolteria novifilia TaxID=2527975 RepID=A0A518B9D7_9BACT|nr:Serine/threonine-protein kinase pkn1 [Planctomycetes bacterium Pan216]